MIKKTKFRSSVLLIIAIVMWGCQTPKTPSEYLESNQSNTLTFVMPGEGKSYDPNKSLETYSGIVLDHCFERLVVFDEKGNLMPAAAQSWKISEDSKTYTFTLRSDAKWSDGKSVIAQDFVNSWLRILDPKNKMDAAPSFAPLIANGNAYRNGTVGSDAVGIKAIDDRTFEVTLEAPTSYFLSFIMMWNFSPIRSDIIASSGDTWDKNPQTYITNGPYKMSSLEPGVSITLVKNDYYWNKNAIKTPYIKTIFNTSVEDSITLFKNNEIDGVYQILANDLRTIPDLESNIHLESSLSTSFMLLNHSNIALSEPDFRAALGTMIDRQKIVDEVLLGAGSASRFIVPAAMKLNGEPFNDFVKLSEPPNLEFSLKLLETVKAKGIDITQPLRLLYMLNSPDEKSVLFIAKLWEEQLGLTIAMEGLEWPDLYAKCQSGDYDIAMFGYGADYAHPMTFLSLFMNETIITNLIRWNDQSLHDDIIASMSIQEPQESIQALRALEERILEGNHVLPLYNRKVISLMSDRISGWYRDDMSRFIFWNAQIESPK